MLSEFKSAFLSALRMQAQFSSLKHPPQQEEYQTRNPKQIRPRWGQRGIFHIPRPLILQNLWKLEYQGCSGLSLQNRKIKWKKGAVPYRLGMFGDDQYWRFVYLLSLTWNRTKIRVKTGRVSLQNKKKNKKKKDEIRAR